MKYYRITSYTPFCGEETYDYYQAPEVEDISCVYEFAAECCNNNAMEWYDEILEEMYDMSEEDYLDNCGYKVEEIDKETFDEEAY